MEAFIRLIPISHRHLVHGTSVSLPDRFPFACPHLLHFPLWPEQGGSRRKEREAGTDFLWKFLFTGKSQRPIRFSEGRGSPETADHLWSEGGFVIQNGNLTVVILFKFTSVIPPRCKFGGEKRNFCFLLHKPPKEVWIFLQNLHSVTVH